MCHEWIADDKFFEVLIAEDVRVAAAVKVAGCVRCGGRLDRADYPRKPRGGAVGVAGESLDRRLSFCCCQDGCRGRATPPSLVFLGRRVYLGIVILVETLRLAAIAPAPSSPSPPCRTVRRWRTWFEALRQSAWFAEIRARVWPALEPAEELPTALVARLGGAGGAGGALVAALRLLAPLGTAPVAP